MFSINTNSGALFALQNLNATNRTLNVVQNRINSGLKVAGAKDDASIFAIAQKQRAELGGYSAVNDSIARAKSATDVALAGAEAISDLLIEMSVKAVAAKDQGTDNDTRIALERDFDQLGAQIRTIVATAEFNGKNALKGDDIFAIVTSNGASANAVTITNTELEAHANGLVALGLSSQAAASTALQGIKGMMMVVDTALAELGAGSKRLSIAETFVNKVSDAIEVGIGNLVDADLARESASLQSIQVKQQLGLQALSIANQAPRSVLSLFN